MSFLTCSIGKRLEKCFLGYGYLCINGPLSLQFGAHDSRKVYLCDIEISSQQGLPWRDDKRVRHCKTEDSVLEYYILEARGQGVVRLHE